MILLVGQVALANAQTVVPQVVTDNFKGMFDDAEDLYWDEYEGTFIANFYLDNYAMEATFQEDGIWLRTATYLEFEELPTPAQDYVDKKYGDLDYSLSVLKVETAANIRFAVNIETEEETYTILFDEKGKLANPKI